MATVSGSNDTGAGTPPDVCVEVTGSGVASAVPDVVRLDVGVRCDAPDVGAALSDAGARAAAVAQAARDHGVETHDVQTTGAGVRPRHDRDGVEVVGYSAHQSLRLAVRDPERLGALVDAFAGVAGNALTIDRISLEVSDPEPLRRRARRAAFKDAQAKAEEYAALAGRTLGKVTALTDVVQGGPQPRYELMAARAGSSGALPVELGENTVTATVVVRWDWT
ncbi:SIMPL domain-containing protein [Knoellia sp. p5-6-4]|uniref:SIMPL domain-containing protein n=1 Tax=unclassified Knoellia TaxID=2618719 RepID=UPI0023D98A25|nr:SIMPL domain-containing protein [Knoellia sp. p5-6-4]MDF2146281.1 SIMPL domain-containing protein [Knoellia sp. p5-6-4]